MNKSESDTALSQVQDARCVHSPCVLTTHWHLLTFAHNDVPLLLRYIIRPSPSFGYRLGLIVKGPDYELIGTFSLRSTLLPCHSSMAPLSSPRYEVNDPQRWHDQVVKPYSHTTYSLLVELKLTMLRHVVDEQLSSTVGYTNMASDIKRS
jgi:hypothetical protein